MAASGYDPAMTPHPTPSPAAALILALTVAFALVGCGPSAPSTPVYDAARRGDLKLVQRHIAAKSKLDVRDTQGWAAVHHAAMRGDLPMMQALAAAGANLALPGAGGKTPLDLARSNGRIPVAKFLLETPPPRQGGGGRGLVDGGLGVSSVLDSQ